MQRSGAEKGHVTVGVHSEYLATHSPVTHLRGLSAGQGRAGRQAMLAGMQESVSVVQLRDAWQHFGLVGGHPTPFAVLLPVPGHPASSAAHMPVPQRKGKVWEHPSTFPFTTLTH